MTKRPPPRLDCMVLETRTLYSASPLAGQLAAQIDQPVDGLSDPQPEAFDDPPLMDDASSLDLLAQPANSGSNTAPNADAGSPSMMQEGESLTLDGSASADPDNDPLAYLWDLNNDGTFADAVGVKPTLTWNMLDKFGIGDDGSYAIQLMVDDGHGGVDIDATTVTVTNARPIGRDDSGVGFTTYENGQFITANVLGNDTDPGTHDVLTVTGINTSATKGIVVHLGDGTFHYDTDRQFEWLRTGELAQDSFDYVLSDDDGDTDTATVTITIRGVNDRPILVNNQPILVDEGASAILTRGELFVADADHSPLQITYKLLSAPSAGHLLLDGLPLESGSVFTQSDINDGRLQYVHDGSETLDDGFRFIAADAEGAATGIQVFPISVQPVNDAPIARHDVYHVVQGQGLFIARPGILENDTDAEGEPIVAQLLVRPQHGMLILGPGGGFFYRPEPDFAGVDWYVYQAWDGQLASKPALVVLQVGPPLPPDTEPPAIEPHEPGDQPPHPGPPPGPPMPPPGTSLAVDAGTDHLQPHAPSPGDAPPYQFHGAAIASPTDRLLTEQHRRDVASPQIDHSSLVASYHSMSHAEWLPVSLPDSADELWVQTPDMVPDLKQLARQFQSDHQTHALAVGSALAVTSSIAVGYVMWSLRGGLLLSGVLTQMPTWRILDPLPVLDKMARRSAEDQETLVSMVEG